MIAELAARVEALMAPGVGVEVPVHRVEEAGPLATLALAKAVDRLAAALEAKEAAAR